MKPFRTLTRCTTPLAIALGLLTADAALADDGEMPPTASEQSVSDSDASDRTVVVTNVRPLRTFRGQAVNLYTSDGPEKSIGVVRPLRTSPFNDYRTNFSRINRFDRSDRWIQREIALGRMDPNAQSIGIVRQYRYPVSVERTRPGVLVFRNPNPVSPSAFSANTTPQADNTTSYEVRSVGDLPVEAQADPWALLNEGFYRDARKLFNDTDRDSVATQTGLALAAALSGDLAGAAEIMPDQPRLPEGVTLTAATQSRLQQFVTFFYEDDAEMQRAIRSLLPEAGEQESAPRAG